ncbi:MAG: DUF748 domain-containing protein [Deltaproteobacteria bacterium]|nr:DUF748 domain-containing protein [Deltaproteobacteria bacterium]
MDAPESKHLRKHWLMRVLLSKAFIIAVALMIIYTLAGFFLAPYLIKRQATQFARESLKCLMVMEEVRVNPYALTLDIRNFDLKERDGSPLLTFKAIFINFEISSLWRWAWTFADVRMDDPVVNLQIEPEGRINFVDIADRIPRKENEGNTSRQEKTEGEVRPPRVIFEHIALNQGRLVFTDQSGPTPGSITLETIGLEFKNLTTLPDKKGVYSFEATLPHGGKLTGAGDVSLHPLWSEGRVKVEGFKTVSAWEFLQDEILIDKPGGEVDLEARYRFANDAKSLSLVIEGLKVLVSALELKARGDREPILSVDTIGLDDGRFDLASRSFQVGELALSRGRATAVIDEQERLNWEELVKAGGDPRSSAPEAEALEGPPWRVALKTLTLDDFTVAYSDRSRHYPLEIGVSRLGGKGKVDLSLMPDKVGVLAENLNVLFEGVSLKEMGQEAPLITLESLAVEGGHMDLETRQVTLERIMMEGGHAAMVLEKAGAVNLSRVLGRRNVGKVLEKIEGAVEKAQAEGQPWSVAVGAVEAAGLSVAFKDQTLSPAPAVNLQDITLKLTDFHSEGKASAPFEASLTVREGGTMNARGRFTLAQKSAEATVQVSNLALTPFQPYVAQYAYLSVDAGDFNAAGKVSYGEGENGPNLQFQGDAHIADLLVSELGTKLETQLNTTKRFLTWQALKANNIQLGFGPERLDIGEVRLIEPYGKLIIYEDKSLNLNKVLRDNKETVEGKEPVSQVETPGGFPVDVRRIRIEKGVLDFADLSLPIPFAAKIYELKGAIAGLSTKEGARAQIQLEGRVDEYGTSRIQGQIEPLNVKHFADIDMVFKNVEMTNLTPYTGKFAGYRIASGRLSLDLHYLIKQSELKGSNQIILDNLTLGEKVESPDAPNIPLELAVALLKDADGRIDIGLPVSGNLDDPQFSYGDLIWKTLINFFTKIVTSPFRALAGMLEVEKENLETIEFEPGRAVLPPPEREKVKTLSEALAKRPQLTLKIQGRFDPVEDGEALKSMAIRHDIAGRAGRVVGSDEDAGPMDVSNPLVQLAIESMVTERISADALAAAKESAARRTAVTNKEGGEAAKKEEKKQAESLPSDQSRELYTALFQKLVEAHPVTEVRLNELARERAEAIKQEFVAAGTIDERRVTVLEPSAAEEKDEKTVSSALTLDVHR